MSDYPLEPCFFCKTMTSSGRRGRYSAPKTIDINVFPLRVICKDCAVDWVTFDKIAEDDDTQTFLARPMGIISG